MKVATQNEVAADFAGYVKATKQGPVVVTDKGKPVAVLLRSESEEDLERLLMGHSPKLQSILEAARKRFRNGGGIPGLRDIPQTSLVLDRNPLRQ